MKWRLWRGFLYGFLFIAIGYCDAKELFDGGDWTIEKKIHAREKTRSLWYHGFNNYMNHAFPLDELLPLSCTGRGPDWENPANVAYNDVSGNFSMTLIDAMDTFVILNDRPGFEAAIRNVITWVSFDVNTKPQVFEATIRVLGGLLSAHIFANQTAGRFHLPWYRSELLDLAHDLGRRLLPAFATPTGIPYARLNLRHGMAKGETTETCTAGAGTLILEFATLSRLTGDDRFEKAAYKAFFALWNRRSDIGLVGNTIDSRDGLWIHPEVAGIGAGIDSFYEYAFKWYVLSGEVEFLDVFREAYASVMRYSRATDGFKYRPVYIHTGDVAYYTVDSLSAFWPGLQVLAGDVQNAIKSHQFYWNLWRLHSGLPEVWDSHHRIATSFQWSLRPEFVESTWYLYRATQDSFYLDVGARILLDISERAKVKCGLAGIKDLRTNAQEDRMNSFALSETLKYLFLLFDEGNPLHGDDSHYVFSTEGHILTLSREHLKPISSARRKMRHDEFHSCSAYTPVFAYHYGGETGLVQGIKSRPDVDYARVLVDVRPDKEDEYVWEPHATCERPQVELYSFQVILSEKGEDVQEDVNPGPHKLIQVEDGYLIHNFTGIRVHIVSRLDGKGYDITRLGPHSVKTGQTVYVNNSAFNIAPLANKEQRRGQHIDLQFFLHAEPEHYVSLGTPNPPFLYHNLSVTGFAALFGGDLNAQCDDKPPRFEQHHGLRVVRATKNDYGCSTFDKLQDSDIVLVRRGKCTFLQKLIHARDAGAPGVVVISDEDQAIHPAADPQPLKDAGEMGHVAMVVISKSDGELITSMMDSAEASGVGIVMVSVDSKQRCTDSKTGRTSDVDNKRKDDSRTILYLHGHPLLNTEILL